MTIKQKQALLFYLGYYTGDIDGIWGNGSANATKAFQKDFGLPVNGVADVETAKAMKHAVCYGMPSKAPEAPETGDFWDGIKYFKQSEFACKCGCGLNNVDHTLVTVAERVREHFGKPITISSGLRCKKHNARVGGVSNSRHLSGKAMDFSVSGYSAKTVLAFVQKQPEIRYAYAIDSGWVHMDVN